MGKESKINTAIEFIRKSNLFKYKRYNILKPLMEKVLDDTIIEEDIKAFVDRLVPLDEKKDEKEENLMESKQNENLKEKSAQKEDLKKIKAIKAIKYVKNVGLIDKIGPVELDSKINIFYGLNATGKSSLYKAICNTLGYEKETLANINEDVNQNNPECGLKLGDWEGNTFDIKWQNGETNPKLNVKIFDRDISLSLVRDDQDNTFSLAYLKQEYFQLLSEFLEKLENRLRERESILTPEFKLLEENLQSKLPDLLKDERKLKVSSIKNVEIPEKERNRLNELKQEYEELQKTNFNDKIKILRNLITQIEGILEIAGCKVESEKESTWKYIFTHEYLEEIKNLNNEYIMYAKILDDKQTAQLKDYIPENWLKIDTWRKFIDSSFDFMRELSEAQQKEYTEKKCPYCHQKLLDRAKKIIESYKILQGELKQKMEDIKSKLNIYLDKVGKVLLDLNEIPEKENLIAEEIKEFSVEKTYNINNIKAIFAKFKNTIINKNKLEYSQEDIRKVKAFFKYYLDIYNGIIKKKAQYEEKNKDKEGSIKELEIKMQPLKYKDEIVRNKEDLLKYIELTDSFSKIENIVDLIIDAKTYVSRLGTDFSNEVFIKEFQKSLDVEYENLNFNKPDKYQLSTRTTYGENKRVYRIGDRKINEIFCEGEQKQHALADFFAQSEIEDFKGIFIFDDPVTSLDECNMEYLAERIIRLAPERNSQIIIFTHNLIFLNYLLELIGEEKVKHFTRVSNAIYLDPDAKLGTEHDLKIKMENIKEKINSINEKNKTGVSIDEFEIRNTYDLLSGYLESFVEIEIFKGVISRYRPNIRMHSLNKVKWDNDIINDVIRLYNKTSRKGSRHSQPLGVQTPTLNDLLKDKDEIDKLVSKIENLKTSGS